MYDRVMDVAAHLLILVGIGCLIMGFVLLSQSPLNEEESVPSKSPDRIDEPRPIQPIKPVTQQADRIWLQDTRELHEPVRPFPTF